MNEQAYAKFAESVKEDGLLVLNASRVKSGLDRTDVRVLAVPVDDVALELGSVKVANTVIIGALIGATGIVSKEVFIKSLEDKFKTKKPEVLALNLKALDKGIAYGEAHKK